MKIISALLLFLVFSPAHLLAQQQSNDYDRLKTEAEKLYAAASFSLAHDTYLKAQALAGGVPPVEARWVEFRLADTLWRSQAATATADTTKYDNARKRLEDLIRAVEREEDRDIVWAGAHESLGDFFWARRDSHRWGEAWTHYQQALDFWGGERDLERARARYLKIVRTISRPPFAESYYYYGYYGNTLPLEVLENTLRIARSTEDKAHAHYLMAMTLRTGGYEQRERAPEEFEAALAAGKQSEWYDDALYHYAEYLVSYGRTSLDESGQWKQETDFVKALELFRRLLREHAKGETRFYDQAKERADEITKPSVNVTTSNIFLPDSEIQFQLAWRNVRRVDFALYRVNLPRDVQFTNKDAGGGAWAEQIRAAGHEVVKVWSKETKDRRDYRPGDELVQLDRKLPVGAYLLEAKTDGGISARDLILVSDASLILKSSGRRALVYFCDALTGAPLAGANVRLWKKVYLKEEWVWNQATGTTNKDGLVGGHAVLQRKEQLELGA